VDHNVEILIADTTSYSAERYAAHLHGEMTVDSSGSGTTVSITLPTQSKAMLVAV
jgi:hypothetical protein